MEQFKLAGCMILYNPEYEVIKNIETYIKECDIFYIVDNGNGRKIYDYLKIKYSNIKYVAHSENLGISYSLNKILNLIIKENIDYLLTMDQDSFFVNGTMENYKKSLVTVNWKETLALSPKIIDYNEKIDFRNKVIYENSNRPITRIITSGSIVNVKVAKKIGGWDEKLFIDDVDFEFCYRGILNNYKCINCIQGVYLRHKVGNLFRCKNKIFNKVIESDHNYIRTYYIVRNGIYVYFKYHKLNEIIFLKWYIRNLLKLFINIILYKNEKIKNLKAYRDGIIDYLRNKMGKKEFNY